MRFSEEGLVLGAGTVLAKSAGSCREISIDPAEPRLHALLAAAHGRRPSTGALVHLSKAAARWSEGDDALAATHLALSRMDRLAAPEADAHRLFLAEGLLNEGFESGAIVNAIEAGRPALERLQKYDPDQPRVAAGSGRASGEWTSADGNAFAGSRSGGDSGSDAQPEVNPDTVMPTAYHDACQEAHEDCQYAAVQVDSKYGPANDNGLKEDLSKCKDANFACNVLSIAIEDIPFLDYGGVIFPHQGVVLMQKGKQDRYIAPLPGGKRPYFRRTV